MKENIHQSGKRKKAIARATLRKGSGNVFINNILLDVYGSNLTRQRIKEPLILAGDKINKLDIKVTSMGGGVSGQADAIRLAIAKALSQFDTSLKDVYSEYDRQLLVADVRRKESSKPNSHGQARAKRQKSYR